MEPGEPPRAWRVAGAQQTAAPTSGGSPCFGVRAERMPSVLRVTVLCKGSLSRALLRAPACRDPQDSEHTPPLPPRLRGEV